MPYETKNSQPNSASARRATASGSGDPPHDSTRKELRSRAAAPGLLTSRVTIVEARLLTLTRSRSIAASTPALSNAGSSTCRPPTAVTA